MGGNLQVTKALKREADRLARGQTRAPNETWQMHLYLHGAGAASFLFGKPDGAKCCLFSEPERIGLNTEMFCCRGLGLQGFGISTSA